MPTVSILVPVYNEEQHLAACLDSLLQQTLPAREIIVLFDEGSTDASLSILQGYGNRIKLVRLPHSPISVALNKGIALASGDIVFYAEADTFFDKKTIERALPAFSAGDVGGVAILQEFKDANTFFGKLQNDYQRVRNQWFLDGREPLTWCYFYRKTVLDKLRGFDESLLQGEDQDLARQLRAAGYRILAIPGTLRWHAVSNSLSSPLSTLMTSFRTAYLHALQSFSPQRVALKMLFGALAIAGVAASLYTNSLLPLASVFFAAYLYFLGRLLPYHSMLSTISLSLIPGIALVKSLSYFLGYSWGSLSKLVFPRARHSRGM